jgi:hypothetical protein
MTILDGRVCNDPALEYRVVLASYEGVRKRNFITMHRIRNLPPGGRSEIESLLPLP